MTIKNNPKRLGVCLTISFGIWLVSCTLAGKETGPSGLFSVPEGFPQPVYNLMANPVTEDGFLLGKKLFFDGRLSRDGTISCGECHNQANSFTHHGHGFSHGIDGKEGFRNAQPIVNVAWQNSFFWDGGVFNLDLFAIAPIENPVEMDEKFPNVIEKLKKSEDYPKLFKKAFGTEEVTSERFLKALSQYMLSLVSANSRYDQYLAGKARLTETEMKGLALFKEKGCNTCHSGILFTDHSFRSNGLGAEYTGDLGRFRITENESDKNKFKVPTLRNIEVTYPYMHDGRFRNLEGVLEHYADGVQGVDNLDPALKKGPKPGIALTKEEQGQIIAFLKTLTDTEFLNNKRFSEF